MEKVIKIILDIIMFVITILLMNMEITNHLIHEILGITLGILFTIHIILNLKWVKAVFKNYKKAAIKTKIMLLVDVIMLLIYISAISTGILISRNLFNVLYNPPIKLMLLHIISGKLALTLMLLHLGLHLNNVFKKINKSKKAMIVMYLIYTIASLLFIFCIFNNVTKTWLWQATF